MENSTLSEITTPDGVVHKIIKQVLTKNLGGLQIHMLLLDDNSITVHVINEHSVPKSKNIHLEVSELALLYACMQQSFQDFDVNVKQILELLYKHQDLNT